MSTNQSAVAALSFLQRLPEDARQRIAQVFVEVSDVREVPDGGNLVQEGHLAFESGYVLVDGVVVIEKDGSAPVEVAAPAILGEMSQFKSDTRTASVRAKGATRFLQFQWQDLYGHAKTVLQAPELAALKQGIERLVWDRSGLDAVLKVGLFQGLPDELRLRACMPLAWISERQVLKDGEVLFREGNACKLRGYILLKGAMVIVRGQTQPRAVGAPTMIGIMPKLEPEQNWSATATAKGDSEVRSFSWKDYLDRINSRLSREEQQQLLESMKANASGHFWH